MSLKFGKQIWTHTEPFLISSLILIHFVVVLLQLWLILFSRPLIYHFLKRYDHKNQLWFDQKHIWICWQLYCILLFSVELVSECCHALPVSLCI